MDTMVDVLTEKQIVGVRSLNLGSDVPWPENNGLEIENALGRQIDS